MSWFHHRNNIHRKTVLALLGIAALALAGCSSAAEKLAETAAEAGAGGDVDIDIDEDGEGSFSFEGEDGSGGSFTAGGSVPDDWPDDVPLPDGHEVMGSTEIRGDDGVGLSLVLAVSESAEEAVDFYEAHFEDLGWTVSQRTEMGEMFNLVVEGDDRMVTVGAIDEEGEPTTLTLNAFGEGV